MTKRNSTYTLRNYLSSIFMALALLWLTVSFPFVYASQQHVLKVNLKHNQQEEKQSDSGSPLSNTTEEKPSSNSSFIEEFLHGQEQPGFGDNYERKLLFPHYEESLYLAFHGELISPPPNPQA
jgi:hypothetical protein